MKKRISVVAIILAIIMLIGVFASCTPGSIDPNGEESSESTTDKNDNPEDVSSDEDGGSNPVETESINSSDLTLTPIEDVFPDVSEYERIVSRENFKPTTDERFNIRVEAENYDATTVSYIDTQSHTEFSGGRILKILTNSRPVQGWEYTYSVSYVIDIPRKGYYQISALTSTLNQAFTSDFFLEVNGRRVFTAADSAKVAEDIDYTFDPELMFLYDLGTISLEEGENTFSFVIDNEDSRKSKDRLSFFFDYFTVAESIGNVDIEPSFTIGADISALDDSDVILGAANVNVFDRRLPLKLSFAHYFVDNEDASYAINDYFGNTVYEGTFSGEEHDVVKIERLIKNHPTGYFTFVCGNQTFSYVVTPPYSTRTLEDSPFAMDLAAFYHIKTLENSYNVTAAARLAGVTWVRDRARWDQYEPTQGEYDFSGTESLFKAIDSTGMKLLVNLCGSPSWAKDPLGYTGSWSIGGFRDNELAFYNMCKKMAAYYDGVVDAWELWNESDHELSAENAEHFSAWYKAGALGVLESSPETIVMIGGYCRADSNLDYDHLSMMNDILLYSNTFNYHSHILQPKEYLYTDFTTIYMSEMAHASLSLYNGETARPTWITEAGMRIDNMVQESFDKQANYIITSAVESFSIGTEKHFWFVAAPYTEGGGDFGTFSPNLEPYPALAAESIMTYVLGKAEYVGVPTGLSKNAYGYTFYTGERYASVLWSIRNGDKYIVETDSPIIVTDMMGNETLYQPENGKITVRLGINPVYITYSDVPDHLPHGIPHDEMTELTFTAGEKVVIVPEFENYDVNDPDIRTKGHLIYDGLQVKVRVINLNGFEVSGTVDALLGGFEFIGTDEEITVAPYSESFVTLTLKKTGDEAVNSYATFSGTFNGEKTSRAAAHVRTEGALDVGSITFDGIFDGQTMSLEQDLSNITATVTDAGGTPIVLINDQVYNNYTYDSGVFTLNIYEMDNGRYTLIVAVRTDGGDYVFKNIFFTVENGKYTFKLP